MVAAFSLAAVDGHALPTEYEILAGAMKERGKGNVILWGSI